VMGANRWREDKEWPPASARPKILYLESSGHANTLGGDGMLGDRPPRREGSDSYIYDPRDPVPTRGGAVCCNPRVFPWGPLDQRTVEKRQDVLVYTTAPLETGLEVIGQVKAVIYVASNARDTDFTAKLVDVFPGGAARILSDGILRLRYRQSLAKPVLPNPGTIYKVTIDAGVTANYFPAGHRLRLEVSSSNFPRFDRNPNTGGPIASETRLVRANQRIYHGGTYPSRLELLVMPPVPAVAVNAGNLRRD